MADPTAAEVQAALAILAAAEAAREAAIKVAVPPVVVAPVVVPVAPVSAAPEVPVVLTVPPVPAAPTQPVNALAALDADVATYSEVASRLSSLRSSLVGLSEHDARQLHAANYAKVLSTMRKQNLLP